VTAKKPQWLKDNPNDFVRLADTKGNAAPPVESARDVGMVSTVPSAHPPTPPKLPIKATQTPTTAALSLSAIAESTVSFNGRPCISTEQFALMLGISKRTLYRLFEKGQGPASVKIASPQYDLDEALKWAAAR
jgi:predicted DNA-binding transcriptional regulator AlpA